MTTTSLSSMRRALTAAGNLVAGAGALALAAATWNPLPVILFGLGQPIWLYRAATSRRHAERLRAEDGAARARRDQRRRAGLHRQLHALIHQTPCGGWLRRGLLPDYPGSYRRLVELRDATARLVEARRDDASSLEDRIVSGLDEMLCAYLTMARERLLFHCALAHVYPALPPIDDDEDTPLLPDGGPRPPEVALVGLDDAVRETERKQAGLSAEAARAPDDDEVYAPLLATLGQRLTELRERGRRDRAMAAQLAIFPDQFELIHARLASAGSDIGAIVTEMQVLIEQTDDTVRFVAELR